MSMIAVIDYGMGNLRSVSKALETVGAKVEVTNNAKIIRKARGIVLPGVGAFQQGMQNLQSLGLTQLITQAASQEKPLLGICLGFQLLFEQSEEHGIHPGLGLFKGKVKRLEGPVKIPHMGWNQVAFSARKKPDIFKGIPNDSYFYFVHSYYALPEDENLIASTTTYAIEFASSVAKGNLWAVQFHPEKSHKLGLKILENFNEHLG